MFSDTITNISAVLSELPSFRAKTSSTPANTGSVEEVIKRAITELEGWCSAEKAAKMATFIRETQPSVCVEIGVYGGRSLFPCAAALRENGKGIIYGIEAWDPETAVENPTTATNDAWWQALDFGRIKAGFYRFMVDNELHRQVRILEARSSEVSHLFPKIDFLHIDGSHSIINAAQDVVTYATRVTAGGIIVMDDIGWESTKPAYDILLSFCDLVETVPDPETGRPSYAILRHL
ncbi:class I SAM-dependent methyltransferase [Chelativorans sp. Marseille-P2723]|uniref:class I SAM-dependent methyltransferase n=1 Tax=Chelativorans sp. Marseille-P2723 TaxID=2709133 RepID=UPI00156E1B3F|nr:class I SAM-dependent methyltransferase [Chelativorans sp. Marseille-P2723]